MATTDVFHRDTPSTSHRPTQLNAREASLRPFARPGRGYWVLLGALGAVIVLGAVAWSVQLRRGLGAAGYNDRAFWAIYIADVVTFIGVSYGGAVISAVLRLTGATWRAPLTRLAEGTAVVTVLIGAAFIIPHLGRPERVWELVTRPNLSSPIFWDFVAIGAYTIGTIVFFVLPLVPDMATLHQAHRERLGRRARAYAAISRGWVGAPRQRAVLRGALGLVAIVIIPLAVSVHSVLSWAFSLVSRPWWHESIWAPYFVVAALYSGVALIILVVAGFRRAYHLEAFITERHFVRLGYILATFAAAYLYLTFADILPDAYVGEQGTSVVFRELLTGHFAPWFWTFVVAAGLLPLLLVAIPRTRTVRGMVAAAALVVPAMWLKRMLMVVDPASYDRMTHLFGVYHFTWISVSITLAGLAAIPLLLMLLFRVVPLLSIDEIEEFEGRAGTGAELAASPARALGSWEHEASPDGEPSATPAALARSRRGTRPLLFCSTGATALLLLVGALSLAHAAPARAGDDPSTQQGPAVIKLTGKDSVDGVHLTAVLTDAHGVPTAHARVQFFEFTTEFNPKGQLIALGSAITDANGAARLTDQPTVTGTKRFVVSYAANPKAEPVSAHVDVVVTTAHPQYQPAPAKPFADIGKTLVGVLLATVALVLLTLAVQVERVRRACRAGL
jgi:molybdopterin-containing oxidoreductase family membrane subunit